MRKRTKLAILSISLLVIITAFAVSPALGEIQEVFPGINTELIKMVVTLPTIVIIPFSFLSSKLSLIMMKRKIVIIGLIIYIIGGVGGGFCTNIHELLFFRMILGIGMGLLTPLTTSLIADFFTNNERMKMMGWSNATANLGGLIATLIGGWMAAIHWRYVFGVYLLAVVVLAFTVLWLPEPPKIESNSKKIQVINTHVILLVVLGFLLNIVFYSVVTNVALFMKDENLGDAASAGIALSFLTLAGFISGLLFQQFHALFKQIKIVIAIGLMGIGFFILSKAHAFNTVVYSTFIIGFGFGVLKPLLFLKVTEIMPRRSNAFALSMINSGLFFGKFMSPLVLDFIGRIFGNNTIRFVFTFAAISLTGAASIALLLIVRTLIS